MHIAILQEDNFKFEKAKAEDAYFAFIIDLPFRIRVQSPFRCHFSYRGRKYDTWIKNSQIVPIEPDWLMQFLVRQGAQIKDLWSTVAIIPNESKVTSEELLSIQNCQGNVDKLLHGSFDKRLFPAMQALNAFIIGYQMTTKELFGGQALRLLRNDDLITGVRWEVCVLGIPIAHWSKETIDSLFNLMPSAPVHSSFQLTGELYDLPVEKLGDIGAAISRLDNFYFHELAFEAKAKMISSDYIGALLMAVAALEGVHGVFVNTALGSKLPINRTGEDKDIAETFIKELGFSICNKLTPYLFIDPTNRPTEQDIKEVTKAIKYRNEIMHALRTPTGAYKIRLRTNKEICEAYSAVLRLFDLYNQVLEKSTSEIDS